MPLKSAPWGLVPTAYIFLPVLKYFMNTVITISRSIAIQNRFDMPNSLPAPILVNALGNWFTQYPPVMTTISPRNR